MWRVTNLVSSSRTSGFFFIVERSSPDYTSRSISATFSKGCAEQVTWTIYEYAPLKPAATFIIFGATPELKNPGAVQSSLTTNKIIFSQLYLLRIQIMGDGANCEWLKYNRTCN